MNDDKRYPIKTVASQTGLSVHAIRAWEKRYNVVKPVRTETNRRLYSEQDIKKLSLLHNATQRGHTISSIADLSVSELIRLIGNDNRSDRPGFRDTDLPDENKVVNFLSECIEAIKNFDAAGLEKSLIRSSLELTQPVLVNRIINPLLVKIGEFWQEGDIRIMHEHMATAVIKPFLANMRNAYRPSPNAASAIVSTPLGQIHEMGALVIALVAAAEGLNVTYLGPSLPAEEIAAAAEKSDCKFVVLSVVYPADDPYLIVEFKKLRSLLDRSIKNIVGGRAAENYRHILIEIDAKIIPDLAEFRTYLDVTTKQ